MTIDELTEQNRQKDDALAGRFRQRLVAVSEAALQASIVAGPETLTILADAERALKRAAKRAEALSGEWDRQEFVPQVGPRVEFTGRLVAENSFTTAGNDSMMVSFEVWETRGGAYVAVTTSEPANREGFELVSVTVVEPKEDRQAMHFAVMDHFDWTDRARAMARKAGWSLRVEVE